MIYGVASIITGLVLFLISWRLYEKNIIFFHELGSFGFWLIVLGIILLIF